MGRGFLSNRRGSLNEQTYMYMSVTPYGIGIDMAKKLTQKTDKILKENFPEVETVFGKAGRADTATDPAPLSTFAHLYYKEAPSILKAEKGKKVVFIYITPNQGVTSELYKKEGSKLLADLQLPTGYYFEWAGESEYLESAMKRLSFILPITFLGGLLPIMYINGVGSEVMQRIAAPMIGGVVSSAILTLIVIPAIYFMVIKKKK